MLSKGWSYDFVDPFKEHSQQLPDHIKVTQCGNSESFSFWHLFLVPFISWSSHKWMSVQDLAFTFFFACQHRSQSHCDCRDWRAPIVCLLTSCPPSPLLLPRQSKFSLLILQIAFVERPMVKVQAILTIADPGLLNVFNLKRTLLEWLLTPTFELYKGLYE